MAYDLRIPAKFSGLGVAKAVFIMLPGLAAALSRYDVSAAQSGGSSALLAGSAAFANGAMTLPAYAV